MPFHRFAIAFLLLICCAYLPAQSTDSSRLAQKVYTGIYLMNVYDLDINAYSFYADFYLWFRWRGKRDPSNIEFVNAVEKWGFTQTPFYPEPKRLPDSSFYNGYRIEGRFYHSFVLNDFPLDRHVLDIRVENVDFPLDSLVYIPDTSSSLYRPDFSIPGWRIREAWMKNHTNFYRTNFGEPTGKRSASSAYSNFTFNLTISRPLSYFFLKLMLPLLVVILAGLGSLFIHPKYLDARISLPIGALLSCVFLQQSYSAALPDVGYMVLMDRIYLLSYLLIAIIMLRVILAGNQLIHPERYNADRIQGKDRRRALFFFGLFIFGIGFLMLLG